MIYRNAPKGIRKAIRGLRVAGLTATLVAAMSPAPAAAAAREERSGEKNRVVNYRGVDRAEIENLQRWVAAGHEDWCKDARLVAAEELKRIAADFTDDAWELRVMDLGEAADGSGDAKRVAFEWTPLDGQATYRVTLERFDWLLPIAKDANAVVWVPTVTEIEIYE